MTRRGRSGVASREIILPSRHSSYHIPSQSGFRSLYGSLTDNSFGLARQAKRPGRYLGVHVLHPPIIRSLFHRNPAIRKVTVSLRRSERSCASRLYVTTGNLLYLVEYMNMRIFQVKKKEKEIERTLHSRKITSHSEKALYASKMIGVVGKW